MTKQTEATPRTPAPVEVGILADKTIEQQGRWYAESLSYGAIKDGGLIDVWGVYIAGSDAPICHTGNGPTSEANARFIADCFNGTLERDLTAALTDNGRYRNLSLKYQTEAEELRAECDALRGALGRLALCHKWQPGLGGCVCDAHIEAEALVAARRTEGSTTT